MAAKNLTEGLETRAEEPTGSSSEGRPEASVSVGLDANISSEKIADIMSRLSEGCRVMKDFAWQFPLDSSSNKLDVATAGFQSFYDGIAMLSSAAGQGRRASSCEVSEILSPLESDLVGILQFCLDMYTGGVRKVFTARIKFAVLKLRALSPKFRSLMRWEELPWGDETMPQEEKDSRKEQDAKTQEQEPEHNSRWLSAQHEEADFRLAWELQTQEVKAAKAQAEEQRRAARPDTGRSSPQPSRVRRSMSHLLGLDLSRSRVQ
eukprot:TRINITY_DN50423_c0_g1_i1.p1 TRINITY_DN50423_c0_g1~~TRINITY_DN50423_c0_g1_i1.p1  ORF type:complete len:263 (-),score=63.37 TRINITY_DN50423_c0_g1_i1:85-873(-)